jgi:hypothetical protein
LKYVTAGPVFHIVTSSDGWVKGAALGSMVAGLAAAIAALASSYSARKAGKAVEVAESGLAHIRQREARDRAVSIASDLFPALFRYIDAHQELNSNRWTVFLSNVRDEDIPDPYAAMPGFLDLGTASLVESIKQARSASPDALLGDLERTDFTARQAAVSEMRLAWLVIDDHQIRVWLEFALQLVYRSAQLGASARYLNAQKHRGTAVPPMETILDAWITSTLDERTQLTEGDVDDLRKWNDERVWVGLSEAFDPDGFGAQFAYENDVLNGLEACCHYRLIPQFERYIRSSREMEGEFRLRA